MYRACSPVALMSTGVTRSPCWYHVAIPTLTHTTLCAGWEQEFFVIDAELAKQRPDLMACGRTLLGQTPLKVLPPPSNCRPGARPLRAHPALGARDEPTLLPEDGTSCQAPTARRTQQNVGTRSAPPLTPHSHPRKTIAKKNTFATLLYSFWYENSLYGSEDHLLSVTITGKDLSTHTPQGSPSAACTRRWPPDRCANARVTSCPYD